MANVGTARLRVTSQVTLNSPLRRVGESQAARGTAITTATATTAAQRVMVSHSRLEHRRRRPVQVSGSN